MKDIDLEALTMPVRVADDRCVVFTLSDGDAFPVPHPPELVHDSAFVRSKAGAALEVLDALEAARRKVRDDENLSDLGRVEKIADLRRQSERIVADLAAETEVYDRQSREWEAKTFAPPVIDRSDAVTVAEDIELRGLIRAMTGAERAQLLAGIVDQPRMMEAILRSPIPIPTLTEAIQRPWRDHVTATHPDAPRVAASREGAEWAVQLLQRIRSAVGVTPATITRAA